MDGGEDDRRCRGRVRRRHLDVVVRSWATDEQHLVEVDQSEHPIRMAVLQQPIVQRVGWVEIPDAPGLGVEINRTALAEFAV